MYPSDKITNAIPDIVGAWPLTAQAGAEPLPVGARQLSQNRCNLLLLVVNPNPLLARGCQDIRLLAPLQPVTQLAIVGPGFGQIQLAIEVNVP